MTITAREKLFIRWGAVGAGVFLVFLFVLKPLYGKWGESRDRWRDDRAAFTALRKNVNEHRELDRSIENWEKKLSVKRQKGSMDEQRQSFVKSIEQTAGKCRVNLSGIHPRSAPGQRRKTAPAPGDRVAYSLSGETDQAGLLKFLKELDALDNPVAITNFEAKTSEKDQNKIQISLDFYTYLFDEAKP